MKPSEERPVPEDRLVGAAWAAARAEHWVEAWNSRDLEAIMSHYAEDVAFSSPTVIRRFGEPTGVIRGNGNLREHFQVGLSTFGPSMKFTLLEVLCGVRSYSVLYRRETGVLVVDTVELDDSGCGIRIVANYGRIQVSLPPK